LKDKLLKIFEETYGYNNGVKVYFAPGRVNLIGEHTDYNGGHVFPCALTIGTYAAVSLRDDNVIRMYSANYPDEGIGTAEIGKYVHIDKPDWCNYPVGVMWTFEQRGYNMDKGMDIVYYGDIPDGSGLSSSASIEVLTAYFLNDLYEFSIALTDMALMGQFAENRFIGSNCGIMDQFASAMGKKDNAIFLNTATLSYEYAPVKLEGQKLLIVNSNIKHKIATSHYNDRRNESEKALALLKEVTDIDGLGDLSEEDFEKYSYVLKDEVLYKRAKHAVYENQRTIKAVKALKDNDIELFGRLMVKSHESLRDDYEVSCPELDVIVEEALKLEGVKGMRMTGGGFGGCCVGIVDEDKIDEVKKTIGSIYEKRCGIKADFYDVSIGSGPYIAGEN